MELHHLKYFFRQLRRIATLGVFGLAGTALTACGGGGGSSDNTATGSLAIGITDAPGDFITYSVDVLSIELTHADGRVVETLPISTRVDFAQYTDVTEFLTAATVPLGRYKQVKMRLDYSKANIMVEDVNGAAVAITNFQDSTGQPLDTNVPVDMTLDLTGNPAWTVAPGLMHHLSLDFNLAATNTVVFDTSTPAAPVAIKITPTLVADVDVVSRKLHRIRGPLKSVDVLNSTYDVYIHPFLKQLSSTDKRFGSITITTTNTTVYEIDRQTYQGVGGLTQLDVFNKANPLAAVVTLGKLKFNPLRIEAYQVYAGSSVPGGTLDVVQGSVVARSGNTLTINGATLIRSGGGTVSFDAGIQVTLSNNTIVTKALTVGILNNTDISVGQRVTVFGTVKTDAMSKDYLDATAGYARMELSDVRGKVAAPPLMTIDHLTLKLTSINGRDPAIYNFNGTQASVDNYEIDPVSLPIANIAIDSDMSVRGFVTPFGTGPLDFTAQTIIDNKTGNTIQ